MRCAEQSERSFGLLTGRLSDDQVGELQRHLDGCPACRARHAEEAAMMAAFDLSTKGLAGAGLLGAVMQDIEAVAGRATQPQVVRLHPWATRAWLPLLTAAAVVLVLWSGRLAGDLGVVATQLGRARTNLAAWSADWSNLIAAAGEAATETYHASQALVVISCPGFSACVEVTAVALSFVCIALIAGFRRTSARSL